MIGMILSAGLGTRLRPWTLSHPKALVPVDDVPMLERVILMMKSQGFDKFIINVHHFSEQIIDFVGTHNLGVEIEISDESDCLLDTGGGILRVCELVGDESLLIHNVDILSTADLRQLADYHEQNGDDITLLVSDRNSSRKLLFDEEGYLCGWHNNNTGEYKKIGGELPSRYSELAFSGIYIVGGRAFDALKEYSTHIGKTSFPIMDFLLSGMGSLKIGSLRDDNLEILDIGKPDALAKATNFINAHPW